MLKSLQFVLLSIKDLLWPKYMLSHSLKELLASGGNNKEPEDDRKGRSEEGITGKFPSGTDNGAPPPRLVKRGPSRRESPGKGLEVRADCRAWGTGGDLI